MDVGFVFDEYAKPMAIVRPIFKNKKCIDFSYIYVNKAFALFLGISVSELIGTKFLDHFEAGEETWLNGFGSAVTNKRNVTIQARSFDKQLTIEIFPVGKEWCGFFVHDFSTTGDDFKDFEKITEMATKDYLTGAYNRFYLGEFEASASRKNVGITFFDVNNLKEINDRFGHAKGDEVIVELVAKIKSMYPTSKVFRMGGDEFLVLTMDMEKKQFLNLSISFKEIISADVAIGYEFFEEIADFDEAIAIVDSYMYQNKRETKRVK